MFFFHETPSTVSSIPAQSKAAQPSMGDGWDEPYPAFPDRYASMPPIDSSIPLFSCPDPSLVFVEIARQLYRANLLCSLSCRWPSPSSDPARLNPAGGSPRIEHRHPSLPAIVG